MPDAGPDVQQLMEKPFWSDVVLGPGCGPLLHTTAGQLGRPVVVDAISHRGSLWRRRRASIANLTGQTALSREWSTCDALSWCLQL
jgi:hypothetical protein